MTSKYYFNPDGVRLYTCPYCLDNGFVHPRKEDGNADYSRTIPCRYCKPEAYQKAVNKTKKS
jgi:hypothetical protein